MSENAAEFSPEQILTAAQRAEADGRLDFAIHFYTHIVDWFPETDPAAIAARTALARLTSQQPAPPAAPPSDMDARHDTPHTSAEIVGSPKPEAWDAAAGGEADDTARSLAHRLAHGSGAHLADARPPAPPRGRVRIGPAPESYRLPDAKPLPRKQSRFWLGRLIASATTALGALMFLVTAIAWLVVLIAPERLPAVAQAVLIGSDPMIAVTLLAAGVGLIVTGQALSALFALSNAATDLASVQRAVADRDLQRF